MLGFLAVLVVVGALFDNGQSGSTTSTPTSSTTSATTGATTTPGRRPSRHHRRHRSRSPRGSALAALAALPVKGHAPKTGYSRDQFGDGWAIVAGCDTRDRMLQRDLTHKSFVLGSSCDVERGRLDDPYTAAAITYVRDASEVDIDHVVALGDAWQKGAQQWSPARRVAFANDPLNLLSADSSANRQKGDGDAATWLPSNKAFRCTYVARQIAVKRRYGAWVTLAERDAMTRVLSRCPSEPLPRNGRRRVTVVPTHTLAPPTAPAPLPTASSPGTRVFPNCDAVRADGLAPLRRGTALYNANRRLDRDGDGLACE